MTFIVIELQTAADGTVGNIVTAYSDKNAAENKFHAIAAAAAISAVPTHAVAFLDNRGRQVEPPCVFYHTPEPEPEAE